MNKSDHSYNVPVSLFSYRDRSLSEFLKVLTVCSLVHMAKLAELYRTNYTVQTLITIQFSDPFLRLFIPCYISQI
jgi:hypothetical protein